MDSMWAVLAKRPVVVWVSALYKGEGRRFGSRGQRSLRERGRWKSDAPPWKESQAGSILSGLVVEASWDSCQYNSERAGKPWIERGLWNCKSYIHRAKRRLKEVTQSSDWNENDKLKGYLCLWLKSVNMNIYELGQNKCAISKTLLG